ncbi:unnamed protein product [Cylindrotheca closterium]|uniref:DUF6824 domain-containing protein n=1 Tax=Cylindrotheca closterium TaxID=2856 RepID=A0AAD2CUW0_9STRA|nr:unnamed protein product [Cylindrotheca closterium]
MSDSAVSDTTSSSSKCCISPSVEDATKKKKAGLFVKDPLESDVLFGRGKTTLEHPGNKRMHQIVDKHAITYHSQLKTGKKKIAQHVYDEVMKGGIRFLKRVADRPHGWIVVDNLTAINKINHALRCKKNAHKLISKSEDLTKRFHLEDISTISPQQSLSSRTSKQGGTPNVDSTSPLQTHSGGVALLRVDETVAPTALPRACLNPRDGTEELKRNLIALRYAGLAILPNNQNTVMYDAQQQSKLQELLLRQVAARQPAPNRNHGTLNRRGFPF